MPFKVLKWNVPVDDKYHPIGSGKVVLTACQFGPSVVQVWTEEKGDPFIRSATVIGTGHDAPDFTEHVGSALAVGGSLVWHVYASTTD